MEESRDFRTHTAENENSENKTQWAVNAKQREKKLNNEENE